MLRPNWMAASETVSGQPGRPCFGAIHSVSRSSQTSRKPRRRSAALVLDQSVVRWRAGDGLLLHAPISAPSPDVSPSGPGYATTPNPMTAGDLAVRTGDLLPHQ